MLFQVPLERLELAGCWGPTGRDAGCTKSRGVGQISGYNRGLVFIIFPGQGPTAYRALLPVPDGQQLHQVRKPVLSRGADLWGVHPCLPEYAESLLVMCLASTHSSCSESELYIDFKTEKLIIFHL